MMTDLFLIAHKVRGEPAFDVATKMECPECPEGTDEGFCTECDSLGFWWIIPTSGHRAYPIMHWDLGDLADISNQDGWMPDVLTVAGPLASHPDFASLPDHYVHKATPTVSLATALGIAKPKPQATIIPRRM